MDAYNEIFGDTGKALKLRSKRMELITSNISNANVEGYKSRDIDFKKIMSKTLDAAVRKTHENHYSNTDPANLRYVYRVPINGADKGNTVEVNYEQGQFGRESTRYAATLQFLENRVGGVRRALRGE